MTIKKTGGMFGRNPTFNDVEAESLTIAGNSVPDASTILVDGDISSTVQAYDADTTKNDVSNTFTADQFFDEKVAIGHTTAFTPLYMRNDSDTDYNPASSAFNAIASFANWTSGALNNSLIAFNTESNGEWYIGGVQNAGNTASDFILASRNVVARAERVRILAGGGITFNGDTAAANALSDYEEGSWTPALTATGSAPTVTHGLQRGNYIKVGNKVTASVFYTWTAFSGGSGDVIISGLPFSVSTASGSYGSSAIAYFDGFTLASGRTQFGVLPLEAGTTARLQQFGSGSVSTTIGVARVSSTGSLVATLFFFTSSG